MRECAQLIAAGATVAMGGVGLDARPMRFCLELTRGTDVVDLVVVDLFGGLNVDWLVAAGAVDAVRASFVSLELFGLAPRFRSAVEEQVVRFVEETELGMIQALRAAAIGAPFMPVPGFARTDTRRDHPAAADVTCPFTGTPVPVVAALPLDVAVIHALEADEDGNSVLAASRGFEREACAAAGIVIVTAERVVPRASLSARADLPGAVVDRVVEAPRGSWPGGCAPLYGPDIAYLTEYAAGSLDLAATERLMPW